MLAMAGLLFLLIKIADIIRIQKFSSLEKVFICAPFSVYFVCFSVSAISYFTFFLVCVGWNLFGIAFFVWSCIVLLVGAIIGILRMIKDKNIVYGLVFVWAYLGILLKHLSITGFDGQYPAVIVTVILCLLLFSFFIGRMIYKNNNRNPKS